MIIAIDFDGTIVKEEWPEPGEVFPNAKKIINHLYSLGHKIIINTCRSGKYEGMAERVLKNEGIKYTWINTNEPNLIHKYGTDCRKISADIYIDNRQLGGLPLVHNSTDVNWDSIYNVLRKKHNVDHVD